MTTGVVLGEIGVKIVLLCLAFSWSTLLSRPYGRGLGWNLSPDLVDVSLFLDFHDNVC
jgi:hypothetical protein